MNSFKNSRRGESSGVGRRASAFLSVLALLSNTFLITSAGAQQQQASKRLSEEQRVIHVLNRLGFGPRPGDVERVRAMGVERYIEEQLYPERIKDETVEAKLVNLPTLRMSSGELLAKYPNPGQLLRRMQRRGELPPELAALRDMRLNGNQPPRNQRQQPGATNQSAEGAMTAQEDKAEDKMSMNNEAGAAGNVSESERREYRRAILAYMRENGLEPPQRVTAELNASRIVRAVYSERQLQEVMVDFWTNHFNVFAGKGADRWFLTSYDRDVIRPNSLGKFRDLLGAVAKSPAMLFYLDNFQSVSPNARGMNRQERRRMFDMLSPEAQAEVLERMGRNGRMRPQGGNNARARRRAQTQDDAQTNGEMRAQQQNQQPQQRRRRGINENYARELMELHTLGVEGGYTQKDVQEVARAFTGWTILDPRGGALGENAGTFRFVARLHDDGEKTVLGQKIPAGGGQRDGETVLDLLARHPSTARFIATKLSRRFVSDDPPPALVARVADAFTKSGGDIRETLRAVFSSPEFNSEAARRAKIKTPFEFAASALRALGAETNGGPPVHQWVARMGEPLYGYQAPTGYPDKAEYWVNTGALLERLNFTLALTSNRIQGTRVDLSRFVGEEANATRAVDQGRVVDAFLRQFLQGDVTPKTKEVLVKQLGEQSGAPIADDADADERATERNVMQARRERRETGATVGNPEVTRIAALILGSPEFQRQ